MNDIENEFLKRHRDGWDLDPAMKILFKIKHGGAHYVEPQYESRRS
jgi:hypothetical protein